MPDFKTGTSLELSKLKVDVEDTSLLSSAYFILTEFDENFYGGKNSFVVNNPPSDLQVEAIDSGGNVLYVEKAINNDFIIRKTTSITLSFHVYPQNNKGVGKLFLLGTFGSKIVRYTAYFNIDNSLVTRSKSRFYSQPTIEVFPLLTFATQTSVSETNPKTATGTFYGKSIYPSSNFNVDENFYDKNLVDYQIVSTNSIFSASFVPFQANLYITKVKNYNSNSDILISQTSSITIKNVINKNTIQLENPFIYKNTVNNKNVVTDIVEGTYNILYSSYAYDSQFFTPSSYVTESIGLTGQTRFKKYSIAEITYRNLDTFSGIVSGHKIYRKSLNIAGDYSLILDENFNVNEILKNDVVPLKSFQNLGNFYSLDFINRFWFTSSNDISLSYDDTTYIDALKIDGNNISNGYIITKLNSSTLYRNSTYVPFDQLEYNNQSGSAYDTNFLKFIKNTEYVLSFNCFFSSKNPNSVATLEFYLTGSYIDNKKEKNYNTTYGVKLADIVISDATTRKNFIKTLQFKFTPSNDLYGTLVIVPRYLNTLIINNLSIKPNQTSGFSLSSYTVRIPFNVNQANELFDIKAELYDNNSNLIYSNLRTIQTFDPSGSSSPSGGSNQDAVFNNLIVNNLTVTTKVTASNLKVDADVFFDALPTIPSISQAGYKFVAVDPNTGKLYEAESA
jgi:hypothetical protein